MYKYVCKFISSPLSATARPGSKCGHTTVTAARDHHPPGTFFQEFPEKIHFPWTKIHFSWKKIHFSWKTPFHRQGFFSRKNEFKSVRIISPPPCL